MVNPDCKVENNHKISSNNFFPRKDKKLTFAAVKSGHKGADLTRNNEIENYPINNFEVQKGYYQHPRN